MVSVMKPPSMVLPASVLCDPDAYMYCKGTAYSGWCPRVCLPIRLVQAPLKLVAVEAIPLDQVLEVGAEEAMLLPVLEALDRPLAADLPPRPDTRAGMGVYVSAKEAGRF